MGIQYQPLAATATYSRTNSSRRRRINPRPYQSPGHGDPLIEALRAAVGSHCDRKHSPAEQRACISNIVDSFPHLSAGKQHVLRVVCLILRSL
jgi:hypothetical protein